MSDEFTNLGPLLESNNDSQPTTAPTALKKSNLRPKKNIAVSKTPSKNLSLQILVGKPNAKNFESSSHFVFSKLNRSSVPPEPEIVPLDEENDGDNKPGLEEYLGLFAKFPFECSLPLPLLEPTSRTPSAVLRGSDPTHNLIEKKKNAWHRFNFHKHKLFKKTESYQTAAKKTLKLIRKSDNLSSDKFISIPVEMVPLARAVEADPDTTFAADYNWYVTGGAMATASVGKRTVLFFSGGDDLSSLVAVPLKKNSKLPTGFKPKADVKVQKESEDGQIYQICSQETEDSAIVAVRQKTSCKFFKYSCEDEYDLQLLHESFTLGQDSFTSIQINPWNASECLTSTRQRVIQLWDINNGKEKSVPAPEKPRLKLEKVENSKDLENWSQGLRLFQWNKAYFSLESENVIFFSDEASVISIDKRDKTFESTTLLDIRNNLSLIDDLLPCETITFSCCSLVKPQVVYAATNHCLFSVDVRKPNCPLQTWKHCLKQPPVFISQSCYSEGRELLLLASYLQKELVGITNEWTAFCPGPISRSQPLLLPTAVNTLNEANKLNMCTNPSLKRRLQSCRVGLCSTNSRKPVIFSLNSAGDVFCQRMANSDCGVKSDTDAEKIRLGIGPWCEAVQEMELRAPIETLKVAALWDASKCFQIMLKSDEDCAPVSPKQIDTPAVNPSRPWMLTSEDLFQSKDMLSSKIVNAWGISSPTDWETQLKTAFGGECEATLSQKITRVEQWLATSAQEPAAFSQSTFVPDTQSQVLSQELVSVSQDVFADSSQQIVDVGPEAATDKDVLKARLFTKYSIVAKKKRRKDGF